MWLLTMICLVFIIWYCVVLAISAGGFIGLWRRTKQSQQQVTTSLLTRVPGVTILRPLKGFDTGLYECLWSSFVQSYPCEILLCVADADDPAIGVARRLLAEFPEADARILIGAESYGPNPKINNLAKGYKVAKYDLIWACDSNVAAPPHAAAEAVAAMLSSPEIQLAHNVPIAVACAGAGRGAELEQMYLSTAHAKFYTGINVTGLSPCVCGKSNFYRRSELDRAANATEAGTGIQVFANYIAEDQMIAESLWENGGRTALLPATVAQPLAAPVEQEEAASQSDGARVFANRRMRWIRIRKFLCMEATLTEPFTECFVSGILGSVAIAYFSGFSALAFFILHCLLWLALDYTQFHMLQQTASARALWPVAEQDSSAQDSRNNAVAFVQIWLMRELICLPIWLVAMAGTQIKWRERVFRLRPDKSAYEINPT